MTTAIVTGATGFVGRWLTSKLLERGIPVLAVIRPGGKKTGVLPETEQLKIIECAMEEYHRLPEKLGHLDGSVFYHLAWGGVSGVGRTDVNIQIENIKAAVGAVEAAAKIGCVRFVGLGSIMELETLAVAAEDGAYLAPSYIYGAAKHFSRLQTRILATQLGIDHLWAVLTNAYGEYENSPRFINTTLRKIIQREDLLFTAGGQNYDFIHIEDAARALIAIGQKGRAGHSYVIGSGQARPLREFVKDIGDILAPSQILHFGRVSYTGVQLPIESFSIQKLVEDTGVSPQISFQDGIIRTMKWLRDKAEVT